MDSASLKTKDLNSEVLILKEDFEEAKNALKEKEDEIRIYQEQIEKMGNDDFPKSPMDGDILGEVFPQVYYDMHFLIFLPTQVRVT